MSNTTSSATPTHGQPKSATSWKGEYPGLRLAPLRPRGLLERVAAWFMKRRFGKVMMPLRVLYPRLPGFFRAMLGLYRFAHSGLSLDRRLRHLLEVRISQNNGCGFCSDLHQALAMHEGHPESSFSQLQAYERDPHLDAASRAALRYADEMRRDGNVSDATFAALRAHFSERQVVEIVWLYAFITYLNLMAKPLGMGSDGFCEVVRHQRRGGTRARRGA